MTDERIIDNIRRIAAERGVRLCDIAAACAMRQVKLSQILAGDRTLHARYIPDIVRALGCGYGEVFEK